MRLGQLARKLDTKTEEIVSFLEQEKKVTIKTHPNSKIADDLIDDVVAHFSPSKVEEKEVDLPKEQEIIEKTESSDPQITQEEPEYIPSPKLEEVTGPKIVGKIDLPDKSQIEVEVDGVVYNQEFLDNKKKEELKQEKEQKRLEAEERKKEEAERKAQAIEKRKIEAERQAMLESERNNILSAEEEQKKAIIEKAIKEREEKLEQQRKKRQKENYLKNYAVKAKKDAKLSKGKKTSDKLVNQSDNETPAAKNQEVKEQNQPVETNLFKRFIKWLNSE